MDAQTARQRDALITGEAVLLDLLPASFATRMVSAIIDGVLQLILFAAMTVGTALAAARGGLDDGFVAAALLLAGVLAWIGYPVLCELLLHGRSPGRLVMGTRVVREDGGPVHLRQSILRAVMAMFEIWSTSGALALTTSVIDRRSRRLGDMLAGTLVMQERLRAPIPRREQVPPDLADWAATADVGRLPLTLAQEIRGFLPRAGALVPESRRIRSRDLLQRTLPSVSPPPPPGTDPEDFLRAVIAERSRRDEVRLRRAAERRSADAEQVAALPFRA
ncbi:RDD family protein [Brachybacterium hainanense]|uniref:RDD family protein n=1 Tax=Brachybacterium hainanense TaxID=1541174 RepID=A0ABV6RBW2_9MICO